MLLAASLGLSLDAPERRIVLNRPSLPESVPGVRIEGLQLRGATVDLALERMEQDVRVDVSNKSGRGDVVVRH